MTSRWSPEPATTGGFDPVTAETHVSLLVFAGDRAYKLKKPIHTPFLDFSSPELRRRACEREVELNRRLAPDVYLGVADITGPDGRACDHLTVMRRMPADRRLAHLVRTRAAGDRCLDAVAETVARFHAGAETGPHVSAEGSRDAVLRRWEANISEMQRFVPRLPDPAIAGRIAGLARAYLAGREPLFQRRVAEGRVRDGHGDLLADDVFCLDDGPRILDCLEFDDRLRYVDVLDDASFLAMDLERLGGPQIGQRFLEAYQRASGEEHPPSLAHHYMAYRAQVRAKVACIRNEQGDLQALGEAAALLAIALRHLDAARIVLMLIGGLPGTGKSTLAAGLTVDRDWTVLRSDEVRKDLAGIPRSAHDDTGFRQGLYTNAMTEATYGALLEGAGGLLRQGTSVVLDASWSSAEQRQAAGAVARDCAAELVALRCEAPLDLAITRLAGRARRGIDASDATPAVARSMAAAFDPWPEAATVDTSEGPEEALERAREALALRLAATRADPGTEP
jgi:hypothetical protein